MTQRFPPPVVSADLALANANAGKPRYSTMADWAGGNIGEDPGLSGPANQTTAKATVALARQDGGAAEADYSPRDQWTKGQAKGQAATVDVGVPRGSVAPYQRYPVAADPALPAPVVTSISPTTAPAASLPLMVTITGTGFTPWSKVFTGGAATPDGSAQYVSPTTMKVPIWKASAGTVSVAVEDHDVLSNTNVLFTVT